MIRTNLGLFFIRAFVLLLKYTVGYDKVVIYVSDLEKSTFDLRRYFVKSKTGVVQSVVTGMHDMKQVLPRKEYLRHMHELKEYCEKESSFYIK